MNQSLLKFFRKRKYNKRNDGPGKIPSTPMAIVIQLNFITSRFW